jgi:large repetitive protein
MRTLCSTLVAGLIVLVAGPLSSASAAPSIAISSPASGVKTQEHVQSVSGTSSDALDLVTLKIYEGVGTAGTELPALEAVSPVGGAWSVQLAPLADGTYTAVAEQQESGSPLEPPGVSPEDTFTVDSTAPTVTLTPVAAATRKATPSFSGAAGEAPDDSASVGVVVYAGSTVGGKVEASGTVPVNGGTWSYTSTSLADGQYTVAAFQGDEAGNVGSSSSATFVVDTVAPALSISSVPAVTANATPVFGGVPGEVSGDGPVQSGDGPIHIFLHKGTSVSGALATPEGTATVSPGAWSWSSPHLPDGSYTVQAEQADAAGNVTKTSPATFRVDMTAPTLSIATPKSNDVLKSSRPTFSGSTGNATGDSFSVTIEIFAGEAASGEPAQKFSVERSGSSWTTAGSGPRLPNGTYTVDVSEVDSAGNVGIGAPVTFSIDSPSPIVTLSALPRFIGYTSPAFSGSAQASEAEPSVTLKVWKGTSASGTLVDSASVPESAGLWSLAPIAALPEGTYTAQAEQADVASNPPGVSAATTFTVDTTAPRPTLSAAPESTGLETVSGAAGIAPGDRKQVTAELFQGPPGEPGQAYETITVNAKAEGAWSATFAGLPSGEYSVLARQSDEAGNTGSSAPQSFIVLAPSSVPATTSAAPSPPIASFTWVPANPTVGQSVSLASNSTGVSSPLSGFGWDLGSGQFTTGGPLLSTSFATPGAHVVRLQVSDANGLSSIATHTIEVAAQALKLMQPFPIVRIAGSETASGARVKLLTVQAPPATKVAVSCKGSGCKTKSESRIATASSTSRSRAGAIMLAFPRFQRALKAGAVLQIRVSKAGEIGKFTSFTIRRNKLPVRIDACLRPTSSNPSPCPSQ